MPNIAPSSFMFPYTTGNRLWHRTVPCLLLLLHNPTGSALPVLFCWSGPWGKNRLGKGRQRRMYPTSVRHCQIQYTGKKTPDQLSCGFQLMSSRLLSPFGGNYVIHLLLPLSLHRIQLPVRGVWISLCACVSFHCIPSTQLTLILAG